MKIIELENNGEIAEFVLIENEDGSVTSYRKDIWDELEAQREQSGTL